MAARMPQGLCWDVRVALREGDWRVQDGDAPPLSSDLAAQTNGKLVQPQERTADYKAQLPSVPINRGAKATKIQSL